MRERESVMEWVSNHGFYFASSAEQTKKAEIQVDQGNLVRLWEAFPDHITNNMKCFYVCPVNSVNLLPKVIFDCLREKVCEFFPAPHKGDICVVFLSGEVGNSPCTIENHPILAKIGDIREGRSRIEVILQDGSCILAPRDEIKVLRPIDVVLH